MTLTIGALHLGILLLVPCLVCIHAQQSSPLAGYGVPSLETTDVYLNVFLDRLIDVDVKQYRHESILLVGLSWIDPRAQPIVENNRVLMETQNYTCSVPCWSNVLEGGPCCDGVYAPAFNAANAVGFSQDRQVVREFYFGPGGAVMCITSVYGSYYQPMSFENYPFTSMDLLIALDFIDTSMFVEGHPGVTLRPSAAGPRVFELGLGDDSPQWNVQGVELEVFQGPPLVDRIRNFATVESATTDPAPFAPTNVTGGFNTWVREQKYERQSAFFIMRVDRFWQWNLVYGVLPVLLCAVLGLLVFFQDPGDLGGRISVIVTVFLAMTAIQFVLNDSTPQSTYIQPLQQCILIIYICFSISAIESIVVYNLVHWKSFSAEREARRTSWSKYKERLHDWRHYSTIRERDGRIGRDLENITAPEDGSEYGYSGEYGGGDAFVDAVDGIGTEDKPDSPDTATSAPAPGSRPPKNIGFGTAGLMRRLRNGGPKYNGDTTAADAGSRKLTRTDSIKPTVASILREDANYGKALAYYVDKWTFALEALCYVIAIPVIFATQSGYVSLFSADVLANSGLNREAQDGRDTTLLARKSNYQLPMQFFTRFNVALRCSSTISRAERAIIARHALQGAGWCDVTAHRACDQPETAPGGQLHPRSRPHVSRRRTETGVARRARGSSVLYAFADGDDVNTCFESPPPTAIIGRVMAAQANFVRIKVEQTGDGKAFDQLTQPPKTRLLCVVRALLKKMKRQVLVGDVVRVVGIDWVDGRGMVEDVLPRTSKLDEPPVANISRVMLVFSLAMPPFMPSAATRYLVSAEHTGLPVTVVLNKCDLVSKEEIRDELRRLEAWGYDCVAVSVQEGQEAGLDALEERLKGDVTVVAGPSGAGKSSIINALSLRSIHRRSEDDSEDDSEHVDLQAVGDVSERVGRGKHTTRNVTIIELAGGGAMVDTPGFNQPTLSFPSTDLEACFPEIRTRLGHIDEQGNRITCAFKNCRHVSEPGCIVRGENVEGIAREDGVVGDAGPDGANTSWERYDYYVELLEELQATEEHLAKRAMGKRRREGNVRRKKSAGGVDREEARLDTKSHRRTSRRSVKQEISVLNPDEAEDYDGSLEIK